MRGAVLGAPPRPPPLHVHGMARRVSTSTTDDGTGPGDSWRASLGEICFAFSCRSRRDGHQVRSQPCLSLGRGHDRAERKNLRFLRLWPSGAGDRVGGWSGVVFCQGLSGLAGLSPGWSVLGLVWSHLFWRWSVSQRPFLEGRQGAGLWAAAVSGVSGEAGGTLNGRTASWRRCPRPARQSQASQQACPDAGTKPAQSARALPPQHHQKRHHPPQAPPRPASQPNTHSPRPEHK